MQVRVLLFIAAGILFSWSVAIGVLLHHSNGSVLALNLNELGDFLAGITAPLAAFLLLSALIFQALELRGAQTQIGKMGEAIEDQARQFNATLEEMRRQSTLMGDSNSLSAANILAQNRHELIAETIGSINKLQSRKIEVLPSFASADANSSRNVFSEEAAAEARLASALALVDVALQTLIESCLLLDDTVQFPDDREQKEWLREQLGHFLWLLQRHVRSEVIICKRLGVEGPREEITSLIERLRTKLADL